jgi:hypothetical protein
MPAGSVAKWRLTHDGPLSVESATGQRRPKRTSVHRVSTLLRRYMGQGRGASRGGTWRPRRALAALTSKAAWCRSSTNERRHGARRRPVAILRQTLRRRASCPDLECL